MSFSLSAGITITLPLTAAIDLELYRFITFTGFTTTLSSAIASGDTSMTIPTTATNLIGQTLLIDGEPIVVNSQTASGATTSCQIQRAQVNGVINVAAASAGITPSPFAGMAAASHSSGATIKLCTYSSASNLVGKLYYTLLVNTVLPALGTNSATMGSALASQQTAQSTLSANTASSSLAVSTA